MAKRKLTARQVRYLFATGRLRASGKGKDRKVTYSREGGKRKPSKAERDATRAERVAAGRRTAQTFIDRDPGVHTKIAPRLQSFRTAYHKNISPGMRGDYFSERGAKKKQAIVRQYKRETENARLARTPGSLKHLPRAKRIARARQIAAPERKLIEHLRSGEKRKADNAWYDLNRDARHSRRTRERWGAIGQTLVSRQLKTG